jgi:hypothetical protein
MRLGLAVAVVGVAVVTAGCLITVAEPKQREDWSLPPMQYGNTRYEGLRAPAMAQPRKAEDGKSHTAQGGKVRKAGEIAARAGAYGTMRKAEDAPER